MQFGRKMVLMNKWDCDVAMELIERERISNLTAVPTMVMELMAKAPTSGRDLSSLKQVASGGAPPPAGVASDIKKQFKANPSQAYGLTEVNAVATSISSSKYENRPKSCGQPIRTCLALFNS
jgi:acyl-CoA synthetase (AMP-forming)/AMP-acid ligase II